MKVLVDIDTVFKFSNGRFSLKIFISTDLKNGISLVSYVEV